MQHPRIAVRRAAKTIAAIAALFFLFCGAIAFVQYWNGDGGDTNDRSAAIQGLGGGIAPDATGLPGSSASSLSLSKLFDHSGKANTLHYDSDISMRSQNAMDTLDNAVQIVNGSGGTVLSMNVDSGDGESATAQFKVPTAKLLGVVDQVSALGTHVHKSINASDASQYSYSYGTTAAQDQVNNATFYVEITTPKAGLRDRSVLGAFGHAVVAGWNATGFLARIVLTGIGTLLPLSLIIVPAVLLLAIGIRLSRHGWRKLTTFLHI